MWRSLFARLATSLLVPLFIVRIPQFSKDTTAMSSFTRPFSLSESFARSVAIAALMSATMLAGLSTATRAETPANAVIQLAQTDAPRSRAATGATEAKGETVEQRITNLQRALKITSDQEPKWNAVAQAMRENATSMDTLIAVSRKTPPQNMTAVNDFQSYQKFEQAHVDGLKNLIGPFETLYAAMPDAQKKIADDVFRTPQPSPPPPNYGPFYPFFPLVPR